MTFVVLSHHGNGVQTSDISLFMGGAGEVFKNEVEGQV